MAVEHFIRHNRCVLSQTQPTSVPLHRGNFLHLPLFHAAAFTSSLETPLISFPVILPSEVPAAASPLVESSVKTGATSSDSTTRAVVTSQEPISAVRPVASSVRRSSVKSSSSWSAADPQGSTAHPETTTAKTRPRPTLTTASKFVTLSPVLVVHVSLLENCEGRRWLGWLVAPLFDSLLAVDTFI